jgi:hypothetical protein
VIPDKNPTVMSINLGRKIKSDTQSLIKCWNCGMIGHLSRDCQKPRWNNGGKNRNFNSKNFN